MNKLFQIYDDSSSHKLKSEIISSICNLFLGTKDQTDHIVNLGIVTKLINILKSETNEELLKGGIWALGNIMCDSTDHRDLVIREGIIDELLRISNENYSLEFDRCLVSVLHNVTRGKPLPDFKLIKEVFPLYQKYLNNIIKYTDEELIDDLLWSISYFSDHKHGLNMIIDSGILKNMIPFLYSKNNTPSLRTLGNILTGDMIQTDKALTYGILAPLKHLLTNDKEIIRREVCWSLSNITAGPKKHIQCVINAGIFPCISEIIHFDPDLKVRKEAVYIFTNALNGSQQQINYLLSLNIIDIFITDFKYSDDSMYQICLMGLKNLFVRNFNLFPGKN